MYWIFPSSVRIVIDLKTNFFVHVEHSVVLRLFVRSAFFLTGIDALLVVGCFVSMKETKIDTIRI
jgi:hypothetical protein